MFYTLPTFLAIAATAETPGIDLGVLAQYGVLGIFAAILVWFARGAHQRERDRADRLEEENRRLHDTIQDKVIPALISAGRAVEEASELMSAMQREREAMRLIEQRQPRRRGAAE